MQAGVSLTRLCAVLNVCVLQLGGRQSLPAPLPPQRAQEIRGTRRQMAGHGTRRGSRVIVEGLTPQITGAQVASSSAVLAALTVSARGSAFGDEASGASADGDVSTSPTSVEGSTRRSSRRRPVVKTKTIIGESLGPSAAFRTRVVAKSQRSKELIERSLAAHFFFSTMGEEEINEVVQAMAKETHAVGETVIEQGALGDNFYVVEKGAFDVFVNGKKVGRVTAGGSFGELALLYNSPRAATVRAAVTSQVWALDRRTFRHIVASAAARKLDGSRAALRRVPLLQSLTEEQVTKIAMAVTEVTYRAGDVIIRKGDRGDAFYFLKEGDVVCTGVGTGARAMKDIPLHAGAYFGERALLLDEPRAANVIATSERCVCLRLDRLSVIQLLGPLRELFDHNMCVNVLRSVPMLSALTSEEADKLADGFITVTFEDGEEIVRQGEHAAAFYVIRDGRVDVRQHPTEAAGSSGPLAGGSALRSRSTLIATLSQGDYFGESSLLKPEAQDQTVVAVGRVTCLVLDKEVFEELLGPLSAILERPRDGAASTVVGATSATTASGASVDGESGAVDATSTVSGDEPPRLQSPRGRELHVGGDGASEDGDVGGAEKPLPLAHVPLREFEVVAVLGVGTFGRVKLVKRRGGGDDEVFALKSLDKARVVEHKQEANVLVEKAVMAECEHPFVVRLHATYNEPTRIHFLMDACMGGEMYSLLAERHWLSSVQARFYTACVFSALRHVHDRGFVYRDLKPENLFIDSDGYVRLGDFGFAKRLAHAERTYTLCGTPEYLAPEIVSGEGHDKGADYWALGVLLYEMTCGASPFAAESQMAVFKNILHADVPFPSDVTDRALIDLIAQLLARKVVQRIGCRKGGAGEIQAHAWLSRVAWHALLRKELQAPWVPPLSSPIDTAHFSPGIIEEEKEVPYSPSPAMADWDATF